MIECKRSLTAGDHGAFGAVGGMPQGYKLFDLSAPVKYVANESDMHQIVAVHKLTIRANLQQIKSYILNIRIDYAYVDLAKLVRCTIQMHARLKAAWEYFSYHAAIELLERQTIAPS
jgi:hypothetical protein